MGVVVSCELHKRTWRLQVRRKLRKREQDELRLALYWVESMSIDEKERLVDGEQLVIDVVDRVVGMIQLAAPRIPLDAELLTPDIPGCTHTERVDETLPANVRRLPAHIGARQTTRRTSEEAVHAEH